LEKLKTAHLGDEQSVSAFQKELNELVSRVRGLENEKNLAEQKIHFLSQSRQQLNAQLQHAAERLNRFQADTGRLTADQSAQQQEGAQHAAHLAQVKAHRDEVLARFSEMMDTRESVSQLQQQVEKDIFQLEKEIAVVSSSRDILERENTLLEEQATQAAQEAEKLEAALREEEARREEAAQSLAALEEKELERLQAIRDIEASLMVRLDELRQLQRTLDARTHEAELLKDMISNLEGFPESIKFLSKSTDWNVSAPLLSDIIYCDQPMRVIVEQILEPYLNYYVVNTWDDAARAVRLLSFAQQGRANFFIREEFATQRQAAPVPGVTPMLSYLQIEPGFEGLVTSLLHNVYIAEQSPLGEAYGGAEFRQLTLVDRQGQMIRRAGQLAGGSVGLFEGKKLGR